MTQFTSLTNLKPITTIQKDEIVLFTEGEYSDYCCLTAVRANSDFTNDDLLNAIIASDCYDPESLKYSEFEPMKLIQWLLNNGTFTELNARELCLGDYGSLAIRDVGQIRD